jgi:exopolyphosphatase/guanosine-5'-triphosphate,3'-diphosphate pyrophosphatase
LIADLTGVETNSGFFKIPGKNLLSLYGDIKYKNSGQIAVEYGIDSENSDVLLPAVCIYAHLMKFTSAEYITAARMLPCDAVLFEALYPKTFASLDREFYSNTLLSAKTLARRYKVQEKHCIHVSGFAKVIFEKMKKIHGLGRRDWLLLQTAAILHDIGKYINSREHYRHSFEIVGGSDIVGLNSLETVMVSLICLFHSRLRPSAAEPMYGALNAGDRVRVSKLAAILRISDALDRSHTQKYSEISVKISEDALTVTVTTDADITLEQWSFNDKGRFFEEVFGIKAILRAKRSI